MKNIVILVISGMLLWWGYRNDVGENLSNLYEHRDSTRRVNHELYLMEAKLSKTFYNYLSGVFMHPLKGIYVLEQPLDMTAIAKGITRGCVTREERIRAVYEWITHHIEYDYDYRIYMPDECYVKRRGVCNAYASLMVKMLSSIGIPSLKIEGETKHPDNTDHGRHSWVMAEKAPGRWMLCDPTWDTGGRNEKNEYTRPTWVWYDCPPEVMIYTHRPDDKRFQLLDKPLSRKEYKALPYIHPTEATEADIRAINGR